MVMEVVRMQNQDLDNELKAAIDIYNQEYEHVNDSVIKWPSIKVSLDTGHSLSAL